MKTKFIATAVIASTLFSTGSALAARKIATVKGVLTTSDKGMGMLKNESGTSYYFNPSSEAGKKILSICVWDRVCVVRGVISNANIINAYYVNVGK